MYWDDGDSIDPLKTHNYLYTNFEVLDGRILVSTFPNSDADIKEAMILGQIEILGIRQNVTEVTVDGKKIVTFSYDEARKYLIIKNLKIDLKKIFKVTW